MIDGLKDFVGSHPLTVAILSFMMNWISQFSEPLVFLLTTAIMILTILVKYEEWMAKRKARRDMEKDKKNAPKEF